jgi:hypothetical protein
MKTIKGRLISDRRVELAEPVRAGVGSEVEVNIPEADDRPERLTCERGRDLYERITTRRKRIGPVAFSLAELVREIREGGREIRG